MAKNPRLEAAMKAAKNAKAEKRVVKSPATMAEEELQRMLKSGKVKDITATKQKISKKYGVWPNGMTN